LDFLPRFRQMAEEAGRDPRSLPVTLGGAPEDPEKLKRYRDLGVVRVNFAVPPAKADEVMPILDRLAKLKQQLHREQVASHPPTSRFPPAPRFAGRGRDEGPAPRRRTTTQTLKEENNGIDRRQRQIHLSGQRGMAAAARVAGGQGLRGFRRLAGPSLLLQPQRRTSD